MQCQTNSPTGFDPLSESGQSGPSGRSGQSDPPRLPADPDGPRASASAEEAPISEGEYMKLAAGAWEGLFRAQVQVMRRLSADPIFKKLSLREYDVLFNLSRCPGGWTRLNELNEHLLISQPSLSRMADRLEEKGLVERRQAGSDHRGVELSLTPEGAQMQRVIGAEHVRHIRRLLGGALGPAELRQLTELTTKLRAGLESDLEP